MTSSTTSGFEWAPSETPLDETDINLRAYIERLPEEHLARYRSEWTDQQVMDWDGNFRSDGALMLVCCERDVNVSTFRTVLEAYLAFRHSEATDPS